MPSRELRALERFRGELCAAQLLPPTARKTAEKVANRRLKTRMVAAKRWDKNRRTP